MDYYVVTGAAGFIGSNIISALNKRNIQNIIAVDDLTDGNKFLNLVDCEIAHYFDKEDFYKAVCNHWFKNDKIRAIFHEGACSDTMNYDGRFMMQNNYQYTVDLFLWAQDKKIPFLYASSAAVYGKGTVFKEDRQLESPLNIYGYSKFLFDQYIRNYLQQNTLKSQVVGLRYFNVYGLNEQHKGKMASVVFHHFNQLRQQGYVELFGDYDGYEKGAQKRDFISIEDVVKVNLFFLDNPSKIGIYNLGTGKSRTFNDLAKATINTVRKYYQQSELTLEEMIEQKILRYIDFPDSLKNKYQSFTQADISLLRNTGYNDSFSSLEEGIKRYVEQLLKKTA